MYESDIFITENWAGQEPLHPNYLHVCKRYFYHRDLQGQGKNFFILNFCMDVNDIFIIVNWTGRELLCPEFFICV